MPCVKNLCLSSFSYVYQIIWGIAVLKIRPFIFKYCFKKFKLVDGFLVSLMKASICLDFATTINNHELSQNL